MARTANAYRPLLLVRSNQMYVFRSSYSIYIIVVPRNKIVCHEKRQRQMCDPKMNDVDNNTSIERYKMEWTKEKEKAKGEEEKKRKKEKKNTNNIETTGKNLIKKMENVYRWSFGW